MTDFRDTVPVPAYPEGARASLLAANAMYLLSGASLVLLALFTPKLVTLMQAMVPSITAVQFQLAMDAILYPLFFLLPVAIFMAKRGGAAVRLSGVGIGITILCLFTGLACAYLGINISALWLMLLDALGVPIARSSISIAGESDLVVGIFAVAVMPGIFEELLFRGPILSAYERAGSRRAIFISAILFAMLHGSVEGLPVQFMMGVVLGFAVVSTGSIYAGMMIHTTYNAAYLLLGYVVQGAVDETASGGTGGLYQSDNALALIFALLLDGIVALGIVLLLAGFFGRHRRRHGIATFGRAPLKLGVSEAIVLISGVVTALFLYANSIFDILGQLL
jgi:membrane protease YdiL (CAAX protease family)